MENLEDIQARRTEIWSQYYNGLKDWAKSNNVKLPVIPNYATNNGHMFYMVCKDIVQRDVLLKYLKEYGVYAVFHYLSLHKSKFYKNKFSGDEIKTADNFADCLLRFPFYFELSFEEQNYIINEVLPITGPLVGKF